MNIERSYLSRLCSYGGLLGVDLDSVRVEPDIKHYNIILNTNIAISDIFFWRWLMAPVTYSEQTRMRVISRTLPQSMQITKKCAARRHVHREAMKDRSSGVFIIGAPQGCSGIELRECVGRGRHSGAPTSKHFATTATRHDMMLRLRYFNFLRYVTYRNQHAVCSVIVLQVNMVLCRTIVAKALRKLVDLP